MATQGTLPTSPYTMTTGYPIPPTGLGGAPMPAATAPSTTQKQKGKAGTLGGAAVGATAGLLVGGPVGAAIGGLGGAAVGAAASGAKTQKKSKK